MKLERVTEEELKEIRVPGRFLIDVILDLLVLLIRKVNLAIEKLEEQINNKEETS